MVDDRKLCRVLIVDDEPLARMRLEDLLRDEPHAEIVGVATDGIEAVAAIRRLRPDLVFLDVQMPGRTGMDVAREIGPDEMPMTIFVTAFDQFAVQAFDVAAVDYLVKPFDDERFEQAFAKARRLLALEGFGQLRDQMRALLQLEHSDDVVSVSTATPKQSPYLERIAVETRGKVQVIPVQQIDYITASGPYAELHVAGRKQLIRETMQTLEERLDPEQFCRVHRSVIVRLSRVEALHKGAGGDYEVQLKGGALLRVSRSRREALEAWLGGGPTPR